MINENSVILFQGDSITDVGWREDSKNHLGCGYPYFVTQTLNNEYAHLGTTTINRGISGNRSRDLVARWTEDCVDLKPDYLSILIGVNDTWRRYDSNDPTSDCDFEKNMRNILDRVKNETCAQVLLFGPFLLDVNEKVTAMREDLCGKQEVIRRLACEYGTKYIDLDAFFAEKVKSGITPTEISTDGVHPTEFGHKMIAELWLGAW